MRHLGPMLLALAIYLGILAGIAYVAIHFIIKFW